MPEKHNRILLGTDAKRSIKGNQSETERGDSLNTHSLLHSFSIGGSVT